MCAFHRSDNSCGATRKDWFPGTSMEPAYQQIIRQQQDAIRLQAETIRQQQARIAELEKKVATGGTRWRRRGSGEPWNGLATGC